jgi:hypothetical protein
MSFRNGNKSKLLVSTKVSSPIDHWDMYSSVHSSCSLPESGQFPIKFVFSLYFGYTVIPISKAHTNKYYIVRQCTYIIYIHPS